MLNSWLDYALCYNSNVNLLVRARFIVRATCVVVLLKFIMSSVLLYIYDKCFLLEFIMSSTLFEKTKDQLLDQTRVPMWYKLIRVKEEVIVS